MTDKASSKPAFKKSDVDRLRKMAFDLDETEQRLLKTAGPLVVPRSLRARDLSDAKVLHRIIAVIDSQS